MSTETTDKGADRGGVETVEVAALWVGDRFRSGGTLWTLLEPGIARRHSAGSVALGSRGWGYLGDSVCSFELGTRVEFVPPSPKMRPSEDQP